MDIPQTLLELDSQLAELTRVQVWVEELADRYRLGADTRFAIQLCMEEALANVVIHAYHNEPGHPIRVRSWASEDALNFAIEDEAPPFIPSVPAATNGGTPVTLETITPGGNGIRLLHRFAGSVSYEELSGGNRLTIGFPITLNKNVSV